MDKSGALGAWNQIHNRLENRDDGEEYHCITYQGGNTECSRAGSALSFYFIVLHLPPVLFVCLFCVESAIQYNITLSYRYVDRSEL